MPIRTGVFAMWPSLGWCVTVGVTAGCLGAGDSSPGSAATDESGGAGATDGAAGNESADGLAPEADVPDAASADAADDDRYASGDTNISAYTVSNAHGVPTFEAVGLYCTYSGDVSGAGCVPEYKEASASAWRMGHRLDIGDNQEFRGSLVGLQSGTTYNVRLTFTGPRPPDPVTFDVTTWSEEFPVGATVEVQTGSSTLTVDRSGSADGYTVYAPPRGEVSTIDLAGSADHAVVVNASHVIVRGLRLTGSRSNAIWMEPGVHDVVVEDCEITDWGTAGGGTWEESGILVPPTGSHRIIIQRNRIHDPYGGSNDWSTGHPDGPQAISLFETDGQIVIRFNQAYSRDGHYFNDIIGGGDNARGGPFPRDSDIYGNILRHCWDDAIEVDSHAMNVRVWGNYIDDAFVAVSTQRCMDSEWNRVPPLRGPCYIFRNIIGSGRLSASDPTGTDAFKVHREVDTGTEDGHLYFYHNSLVGETRGACIANGFGDPPPNPDRIIGLNNLFFFPPALSIDPVDENFLDYNCYWTRAALIEERIPPAWEQHGIQAPPAWNRVGEYNYFPASGHPGIDTGVVVPGFNGDYVGAGPDMGALEAGGDALRLE